MIYQEIVDWYKAYTHVNTDAEAVAYIDADIQKSSFYEFARGFYATDTESNSCEEFSVAHMTAFNNLVHQKY